MVVATTLLQWYRGRTLQFIASFSATLTSLSFALGHVWPAPAVPKLLASDSPIPITHEEGSWIASIELLTIPVSSIGTIFLVKKYGSKHVLLLTPIPMVLSWVLTIIATNVTYFYVARFLVGIADAFCFLSVPVYIAEISEPDIRGRLSGLIAISFYIGAIVTYYFGYVMTIPNYAYVAMVFPIINFITFIGMPQSPYFLLMGNQIDAAKKSLQTLRNTPDVDAEFEIIKSSVEEEMANKGGFSDLFCDRINLKSLYIVVVITMIQQLSGMTSMTSYLHLVLLESKLDMDAVIPATLFGVVQCLTCVLSSFLVDRTGRRPLLLVSCAGSAICLFFEGIYFFLKQYEYDISYLTWLPVTSLLLYIFFISIGLGVIPLVLNGEMFATNIKSYAVGMVCTTFGVVGFFTNKAFQIITDTWGMYVVFLMFGAFCIAGGMFIYCCLPETNKKSLHEIQKNLRTKSRKRESQNSNINQTAL